MAGFLLAFVTAFSEACKDIFSKYNLRLIDEYTAAFSMHLVISLLLAPVVLWMGLHTLSARFLLALGAASLLQFAVILL